MMTSNLYPARHKQRGFFIPDIFDSFKDDLASMEHPIYSLSKKPDHRMLEYEQNGNTIKIKPSYTGLATIFDKDILLYLASSLMSAKNIGDPISQTVRFTSYDYLVSVNKDTGGSQYRQMIESLARLSGTRIETNIKTNGKEITEEFGLIESWGIVKEDKRGKAIAISVKLSDWFYNSITAGEVLTIDSEYFRLKKPTERRLYELARKHCGNQIAWKISLDKLKNKLGTVTTLRKLRFNLKNLSKSNHLPEYNLSVNDDVVLISRKESQKPTQLPEKLPQYTSKKELEKQARPGETYDQVRSRISNKDKIKILKKAIARK
jgi:plasmid replication initiation protein